MSFLDISIGFVPDVPILSEAPSAHVPIELLSHHVINSGLRSLLNRLLLIQASEVFELLRDVLVFHSGFNNHGVLLIDVIHSEDFIVVNGLESAELREAQFIKVVTAFLEDFDFGEVFLTQFVFRQHAFDRAHDHFLSVLL